MNKKCFLSSCAKLHSYRTLQGNTKVVRYVPEPHSKTICGIFQTTRSIVFAVRNILPFSACNSTADRCWTWCECEPASAHLSKTWCIRTVDAERCWHRSRCSITCTRGNVVWCLRHGS